MRYEIRHNKRNKRHIVFKVPEKKGLWKIVKSCKTPKEARDYVKEMTNK